MLAGHGERLGTKTDVTLAGQRMGGMFEGLAEGGTAVPLSGQQGTDVEMSVEVEDRDRSPGTDITEEMAKGGLVAAAEDDGDDPGREERTDDFRQGLLALLEVSVDAEIAEIEQGKGSEVRVGRAIPRRQAVEPAADFGRGGGSAGPALVAAHPLVLGKADKDGPAGTEVRDTLLAELDAVAEARVSGS